jgi:Family of unknown function (DUF5675)
VTTYLRLVREPSNAGATFGSLYINDVWACWTLEDVIREPTPWLRAIEFDKVDAWVRTWKVPKATAIPSGRYGVALTQSARFKMKLPELLHVPGFSGIRIHSGNTDADTEGCILVGMSRDDRSTVHRVLHSVEARDWLMLRLSGAPAIVIDVENPPARHLGPSTVVA